MQLSVSKQTFPLSVSTPRAAVICSAASVEGGAGAPGGPCGCLWSGCVVLAPTCVPGAWPRSFLGGCVCRAVISQNVSGPHQWTRCGNQLRTCRFEVLEGKVPDAVFTCTLKCRFCGKDTAQPVRHPTWSKAKTLLDVKYLKPDSKSNLSWLPMPSSFPGFSQGQKDDGTEALPDCPCSHPAVSSLAPQPVASWAAALLGHSAAGPRHGPASHRPTWPRHLLGPGASGIGIFPRKWLMLL